MNPPLNSNELFPERYNNLWLITITKHRKLEITTDDEIDQILLWLFIEHNVYMTEGFKETHGKYNQNHYHGITVYLRDQKKLTSHNGFRIYWSKITKSIRKVRKYIRKNQKPDS